jgi:hypothetical protein
MLASIRDGRVPEGQNTEAVVVHGETSNQPADAQREEVLVLQERVKKADASVADLQAHISALPETSGA